MNAGAVPKGEGVANAEEAPKALAGLTGGLSEGVDDVPNPKAGPDCGVWAADDAVADLPNAEAPKGEAAPKAELPNAGLAGAPAAKADWPKAGLAPNADVGFAWAAVGAAGFDSAGEPNAVFPNAAGAGAAEAGVVGCPKAEAPKAGLFRPGELDAIPKLLEPNADVAPFVALANGFAPNPGDILGMLVAPPNPKDGFAAPAPDVKGDPAAAANGDGEGTADFGASCIANEEVKIS